MVNGRVRLLEHRAVRVPAAGRRLPHRRTTLSLAQLSIVQEVTPSAFVPFAAMSMGEPVKPDGLWAACLIGAV
jgi:uncharacterized protein (DUF486 family)